MYLAIGIQFEDDFTWSVATGYNIPEVVAAELEVAGGVIPDQILLVVSDTALKLNDGPIIARHWNLGKDYDKE